MRNLFEKVTDKDWMNNSDLKVQESAEETLQKKLENDVSSSAEKQIMKAFLTIMKK